MATSIPTRAVKAIIANDQGEILFLQRNPELRDSDNWDLPGGLVEGDKETDEEALRREVAEELGLEIVVEQKAGEWSFYRPLDGKIVTATNYSCRIKGGTITLSEEHIAIRWVLKQNIHTLEIKDNSLLNAISP